MTNNVIILDLSEIRAGRPFCILGYKNENSEYARRLRKMGFVEGTPVEKAPVHITDPIVFQIRGSRIALRKSEAKQIKVREI